MDGQPRVALVTASSRGLGRGIAERLAADGFAVAVNGSNAERTADVAAAIRSLGATAEAFAADVTDTDQVDRLVTEIKDRLGPVNSVSPGFIPVERHADVTEAAMDAYRSSVPAGCMGTLDDVAAAVSYFASQEAGFVTGQRLVVDGGRALGWEP